MTEVTATGKFTAVGLRCIPFNVFVAVISTFVGISTTASDICFLQSVDMTSNFPSLKLKS